MEVATYLLKRCCGRRWPKRADYFGPVVIPQRVGASRAIEVKVAKERKARRRYAGLKTEEPGGVFPQSLFLDLRRNIGSFLPVGDIVFL
jgi:hypothetical protein